MSETTAEERHDTQEKVSAMLLTLQTEQITYFPIRHHSPVCAIHIEKWILEHKPRVILIEGPSSFDSRIEQLTDEKCFCPVALFTNFVDKKGRLAEISAKGFASVEDSSETSQRSSGEEELDESPSESEAEDVATQPMTQMDFGPPRFSAYYPFCDYSPELVALRVGKAVGARLRFIDLEYGEAIIHQAEAMRQVHEELKAEPAHLESLADDSHLRHSSYVEALARKLGCRNFDELWDHLFESQRDGMNTDVLINRLATYCAMARQDYSRQQLLLDGTLAREDCMASAIIDELARNADEGPILVVTGGFHTVALPSLVANAVKRPPAENFGEGESGVWLMRYSFDKLDARSGYGAGMPSPAYYDRLWQSEKESASGLTEAQKFEKVSASFLVEISRLSREKQLPYLVSTPDAIAAMQMAKQLAYLRSHPWPMREDLLDGIRACFVKGEVDIEGQVLLSLVRQVFAGSRVGQLPPSCDLPPIIADFYGEAKRLRLECERSDTKVLALDLYRNERHRAISRLFHRLSSFMVPYATYVDGPDFVRGRNIDLLIEHWQTAWSPAVESSLIEASVYGTTVEEAAAGKLGEQIAKLDDESNGRSSGLVVSVLMRACRMGLHRHARTIVPLIDKHIGEDPLLASVVSALSQLELLKRAREPLEAAHLTGLPHLMLAAYQRACALLHSVANCPEDQINSVIGGMKILREFLASCHSERQQSVSGSPPSSNSQSSKVKTAAKAEILKEEFDSSLLYRGLQAIVRCPPQESHSIIVGAAAGILYSDGKMTGAELVSLVNGFLTGAAIDARKSVGVVRGLLSTASEVAWQVNEIVQALDCQMGGWDEETFMGLLPDLRLAFAALAPQDICKISENVSALHGGASFGPLVLSDIAEADLNLGLALNQRVHKQLLRDGLIGGERES